MNVDIITVPFDSGMHDTRMGRGPDRLLQLDIAATLQAAGAHVDTRRVAPVPGVFPSEIRMAFELQRIVAEYVNEARRRESIPLVLTGNCNIAVGVVAGLHGASGHLPAVCWLDAHADFNTPETTIGGFLDGMAVSMLTGGCWRSLTAQIPGFSPVPEAHVLMIGMRDLDPLERDLVETSSLRIARDFASIGTEIDSIGAAAGTRDIYVHIDLDVLDTCEGEANSYAVPGGLSRSALLESLHVIAAHGSVRAVTLSAYDPDCDASGSIARIALDAAVQLIADRDDEVPRT